MRKLLTVSILLFTVFLLTGCEGINTPQKETYNVSFYTNSTSTIDDMAVEEGTTVFEPVNPIKDGNLFAGWYSDSSFLSAYDFSAPVIGNLILHAKWVETDYTITFETNGGDTIAPLTVAYDATFSIEDPVKEGYAFIDWYLDAELSEEFNLTEMTDSDFDLFAKWQINLYVITFDTSGGSLIDSITQEFNTSITEPANPFLEGYAFRGWYQFGDFVGGFTFDTMPGRDVELVAAWELDDPSYRIAMITDSGSIDDEAYNQAAWEGIVEFAEENNITYKYYRSLEMSDDAYLDTIELAISEGAEIVVLPGWLFETSVYIAQFEYPDVKFILIDGIPHSSDWTTWETADNTMPILFNVEEAGFLAGYATVMDGYRNLGFIGGMAVPIVVEFGIGYIAGAHYAAKELGVTIEFEDEKFIYLGA